MPGCPAQPGRPRWRRPAPPAARPPPRPRRSLYHAAAAPVLARQFVAFINRAKDELVTPDDFDAFVDREREAFEERFGSYEPASSVSRPRATSSAARRPRGLRRPPTRRACRRGRRTSSRPRPSVEKTAEREARRTIAGRRHAPCRRASSTRTTSPHRRARRHLRRRRRRARGPAPVRAGARLPRLPGGAAARGALDFGEQIAA